MKKVAPSKRPNTSQNQPSSSRKQPKNLNKNNEIVYDSNSNFSSEDEMIRQMNNMVISSSDEDDKPNAKPKRLNDNSRQWNSGPFYPNVPLFTEKPGIISNNVTVAEETPLDFFMLFFDKDLMKIIVDETNQYHKQNPIDFCTSQIMKISQMIHQLR
uniref:PiggyBac transposable element-derived protein domain-containing protein n=1 Tax=Acrobeloides nanus TaxID=290746 RepID=A0A914DD66_9BILA